MFSKVGTVFRNIARRANYIPLLETSSEFQCIANEMVTFDDNEKRQCFVRFRRKFRD